MAEERLHKVVNGEKVFLSTEEETLLKARWDQEAAEKLATGYLTDRAAAYPKVGDQLDAILKQLNYLQMSGSMDLITELDGVIGTWLAVKRDFPKP